MIAQSAETAETAPPAGPTRTARAGTAVRRMWGHGRRADVTDAVVLFVVGVLLTAVGLVQVTSGLGPWTVDAPPGARVGLLAAGCVLVAVKRGRPMLALAGGVALTLVDLTWGGSLAMFLVLWDLLYSAALWSGPRARAWLWGSAAAVSIVGAVLAGEAARDVRVFVYAGIQLGAMLIVPLWWADNVRQKTELAALERARADEAARAADLERERATDLARLATSQRHEAVQAERAAMARDLHDVVAAHLSSIAIHSGAALATAPDTARDRAALGQVRESAVASLTEMRAMIELLRTSTDRDPVPAPGRLDRLEELVRAARAAGLDVAVEDPDSVAAAELPAAVGQTLHRIAQEALTNVLKHAPGQAVVVRLAQDAGKVDLQIRNALARAEIPPSDRSPDSGPDSRERPGVLDPGALSAGTGLLTMRERAEGLGGSFAGGPAPDGAWLVRATVPLEPGTDA